MPLIQGGRHYRAMRMLTPKVFAAEVESVIVPAQSLFGFWKGEDNTNNEVVGGQSMIWGGIPAYATGYSGKCFHIRYIGSTLMPYVVSIPEITGFDYTQPFSLEWYFKANLSLEGAIGHYMSHANCTILTYMGSTQMYFPLYGYAAQNYGIILDNNWNKLKITYDGIDRWELYVNDIKQIPDTYHSAPYDTGDMKNIQFWTTMDGMDDQESFVDEISLYA
ncbi:MAG TPA: hypothetical protein VLH16_05580 [Bacteroidales bacterium]|nr:hypothetical protein [Bacteroidales bacterium]